MKMIGWAILMCWTLSLSAQRSPGIRPCVLLITAHPDDWEGIAGGTVLQLTKTHDIHVAIASRGERGIKSPAETWASVRPSVETARLRTAEAEASAKTVGAKLYFLGSIDGEVYADQQRVDSVASIMQRLQPQIIITMWGADVPDHAAVGQMALRAAWQTGLIHSAEFYYGEADHGGQTQQFAPDFYVNIKAQAEQKAALLRLHACQNVDDEMVKTTLGANAFHGQLAKCGYAEPFKSYHPAVDSRFGESRRNTLLTLKSAADTVRQMKQAAASGAARPRLLVVGAHPGDWEDGCGAAVWRFRKTHDIVIVCASRGERGADGNSPETVGPAREREAQLGAAAIGAKLYFLGLPDAAVTSSPAAIDSLATIIQAVDPAIVLTMWPFDVGDHAAASHMTLEAMRRTKHLYKSDLFYYESDAGSQTVSFEPRFYVNADEVIEEKRRLLRLHATENPDDILDVNMMAKARFRGQSARCDVAEGFIPHFPLVNERWGREWSGLFGG